MNGRATNGRATNGHRALALWVAAAMLWFGPLNMPHLFDPDEGRYAEIPREMLASGDWVTPRLDAIKYFEKPVLQYWATAGAFRLFGEHAWSARLWPALCGFLGLLLTWALARALYDERSAALAVIIQASSLLYLALARIATLDMSLSFGLQIAMCALALLAQQRSAPSGAARLPGSWRLPALLGLGLALAVLSKGLVGILIPCAVAGLYLLWMRDWTLPLRAQPWWSVIALAVLAAPWFLAVSWRNPEFAHFFFIVQHFQRYLSSAGFDRNEPLWFFVPGLARGARRRGRQRDADSLGSVCVRVLQPVAIQAHTLHRADAAGVGAARGPQPRGHEREALCAASRRDRDARVRAGTADPAAVAAACGRATDRAVHHGAGELQGVLIVHAIHAGGFGDHLRADFQGAQRGGGVGGEVRIGGAAGEDADAALFQMAQGASADLRLGHLVHLDGAH